MEFGNSRVRLIVWKILQVRLIFWSIKAKWKRTCYLAFKWPITYFARQKAAEWCVLQYMQSAIKAMNWTFSIWPKTLCRMDLKIRAVVIFSWFVNAEPVMRYVARMDNLFMFQRCSWWKYISHVHYVPCGRIMDNTSFVSKEFAFQRTTKMESP